MDLGLEGRIAIVTGASRGIGLAITRGLVAEGARVTAGALKSSAELDELAGSGTVSVLEATWPNPAGQPRWSPRPVTGSISWSTTSVPLRPGPAGSPASLMPTGRHHSSST